MDNLALVNNVAEVVPHLFITNWQVSEDPVTIQKYNIKAIITVEKRFKSPQMLAHMAHNDIGFMHIQMDDLPGENISEHFEPSYTFIKNYISHGKNVLLHCYAGISRSVTIALHYMLRNILDSAPKNTISPENAIVYCLQTIRKTRPMANPNPGFIKQLADWARKYHEVETRSENFSSQRDLNHIHFPSNTDMSASQPQPQRTPVQQVVQPASCAAFTDSTGKPSPVLNLSNDDFDAQGNLKNFANVNGVIFFGMMPGCGHCNVTKPEFAKFANMLQGTNIRAFYVDANTNRELLTRITGPSWGYVVSGFPTIVGYFQGKFYSEYGLDPQNKENFRKAEDFLDFAKNLGKAEIQWK